MLNRSEAPQLSYCNRRAAISNVKVKNIGSDGCSRFILLIVVSKKKLMIFDTANCRSKIKSIIDILQGVVHRRHISPRVSQVAGYFLPALFPA